MIHITRSQDLRELKPGFEENIASGIGHRAFIYSATFTMAKSEVGEEQNQRHQAAHVP